MILSTDLDLLRLRVFMYNTFSCSDSKFCNLTPELSYSVTFFWDPYSFFATLASISSTDS